MDEQETDPVVDVIHQILETGMADLTAWLTPVARTTPQAEVGVTRNCRACLVSSQRVPRW